MDVTPAQAMEIVEGCIRSNLECAVKGLPPEKRQVPMLEGPPGVGKTTVVRAAGRKVGDDKDFIEYIAAESGIEVSRYFTRTVLASQQEAADVSGLPWAAKSEETENHEMIRLRPQMLPLPGSMCTFFLDEFRKAKTAVHNAMGQVLLEYRIGEHKISDHCSIVLASNERKDKAGDTELPSHILDRVTLFRVVSSRANFVEWGRQNGVDPAVLFFVEAMPDYFDKHDEHSLVHPTPRSYERVSDILQSGQFSGVALRAMIEGTLGNAAGHALYSFMKLRDKLPPPAQILAHPKDVKIPDDKQAQWAMMSALCSAVEEKTMAGLRDFLGRFDTEVDNGRELSVMLVQSLWARSKRLLLCPAGVEMTGKYLEVLKGDK